MKPKHLRNLFFSSHHRQSDPAVAIVKSAAKYLGLCLLLAYCSVSHAAVRTWDGSFSPNWSASANWSGNVAPVNGDDVVFPAAAANLANTNNNTVTSLNSITFLGSGYTVGGFPITIRNGISGQQPSGANTVAVDLTLGASQTFECVNAGASQQFFGDIISSAGTNLMVSGSGNMNFSGVISGGGYVLFSGPGTNTLSGSDNNTYTGTTYVHGGTLQLLKFRISFPTFLSRIAIPSDLVVGSGSSGPDVVRFLFDNQIANTSDVTINAAGMLDLNGYDDTFRALNMTGGVITNNGSGILHLAWDLTGTSTASGTFTNATIYGQVDLGGFRNIIVPESTASQDLIMHATLSAGGILKQGLGTLSLLSSNSYTDLTVVEQGTLWIENDWALGSTAAGTAISNGAALHVGLGANNISELLSVAGNGPADAGALQLQGTISWNTNITLLGDTLINCFPAGFAATINGAIRGTGNLTRIGLANLTLAGNDANDYNGATFFKEGLTLLNKGGGPAVPYPYWLEIGGSNTTAEVRELRDSQVDYVQVHTNGLLNLNGNIDYLARLSLDGGGDVETGGGTLGLVNESLVVSNSVISDQASISGKLLLSGADLEIHVMSGSYLDIPAVVSGNGFTKTGVGNLALEGANTFNGLSVVADGYLWISNNLALGTTNFGTIVSNGATLIMVGGIGVTNEPLTLNGLGQSSSWGALDTEDLRTNIWAGPIILNADSTIAPWDFTNVLRIIGPISGSGGFTHNGYGTLYLEGNTTNSYAGDTRVNYGRILLKKSVNYGTIPHGLTIGGSVGFLANYQTAVSSDVNILSTGSLSMNGYLDYIDELTGSGSVDLGGNGLVIGCADGNSTYSGIISGLGALYKFGGFGTITLMGNNTYTGPTEIYYGHMIINGQQPQSPVYLREGSLGGTGTVGSVSVVNTSGQIWPGNHLGTLTTSNLVYNAAGHLAVELHGPTAGVDYDQLLVNGTNQLNNAFLDLDMSFTQPVALGQQFRIINNDGTDPINGTFAGAPPTSTWTQNGYTVAISYTGGSGNDVVLTLTQLPAAAGAAAVTAGNGDHLIDPSECNNLSLIITNASSQPMTGISGTLSSSTRGVMITQPYSSYPDLSAGAAGPNSAPFQLSTLPNFTCGTNVDLQLVIQSSLGALKLPFSLTSGQISSVSNRYDVNIITNVPDIGAIESTNTISSWSGGTLAKIAVSLWLVSPFDSDINLTLVAPNGATVDLSSGNGSGANFGSGIADNTRTIFSDDAPVAITAGAAPFVGNFRPEGSLASLLSTSPIGDWRLRVQDVFGSGSADTLRAWSLMLYGIECNAGGGACDLCFTAIPNSITNTDSMMTNRINRDGILSSCGQPKTWPGQLSGTYNYDAYGFVNDSGADACVTVELVSTGNVHAVAYSGSFDPGNIQSNYLADVGSSTAFTYGPATMSFQTSPGQSFIVVVHEVSSGTGCPYYTLQLSGLPCPAPTLAIDRIQPPGQVRIHWPTWAGGYNLQTNYNLFNSNLWSSQSSEPIVSGGQYNVTNATVAPKPQFYRLSKP